MEASRRFLPGDVAVEEKRLDISLIIPCYNEEAHIRPCLESLLDDFARARCEILVVDGMSSDGTVPIVAELQKKHRNIRILRNPDRLQSHGLNLGIRAARGDKIVRIDAHSVYPKHYVKRCIELLEGSDADNVGGMMLPVGRTAFERAVAMAMRHPAGVANSKFHKGNFNGYADTVYLGTFKKTLFEKLGYFDPLAHPTEDAEMNLRIRKSGGKIYLDSSLAVRYVPRSSFRELARQYYAYGQGQAYIARKHGRLTAARQLVPPIFALAVLGSFAITPLYYASLTIPLVSLLLFTAAGFTAQVGQDARVRGYLPLVFLTMHFFRGLGFVVGLIQRN